MSWVFTRITAHSASLPGRTGSVEPAIAVKIVVPVSLLERALSRVSRKKPKRLSRGRSQKLLNKPDPRQLTVEEELRKNLYETGESEEDL